LIYVGALLIDSDIEILAKLLCQLVFEVSMSVGVIIFLLWAMAANCLAIGA